VFGASAKSCLPPFDAGNFTKHVAFGSSKTQTKFSAALRLWYQCSLGARSGQEKGELLFRPLVSEPSSSFQSSSSTNSRCVALSVMLSRILYSLRSACGFIISITPSNFTASYRFLAAMGPEQASTSERVYFRELKDPSKTAQNNQAAEDSWYVNPIFIFYGMESNSFSFVLVLGVGKPFEKSPFTHLRSTDEGFLFLWPNNLVDPDKLKTVYVFNDHIPRDETFRCRHLVDEASFLCRGLQWLVKKGMVFQPIASLPFTMH
jgi:hypothetical protein